jgi:hypothetical protein
MSTTENNVRDISKTEIPTQLYDKYLKLLNESNTTITLPTFWGPAMETLLKCLIYNYHFNKEQEEKIKRLESELEIRTQEYMDNKITNAIKNLQEVGFKIKIEAEEK